MNQNNPNSPRILMVCRQASGGIRRHLQILCEELPNRGFNLQLAAPEPLSISNVPSISRYTLSIGSGGYGMDILSALQLTPIARHNDLIYGHGVRGGFVAAITGLLSKRPVIATIHNQPPDSRLARSVLSFLGKRCRFVIAVSHAVAADLATKIPADKLRTIPNGIRSLPFLTDGDIRARKSEIGVDPDRPLIMSVGRIAPEKNMIATVRTMPMIWRTFPDMVLVIVGDGPNRGELEAEVKMLAERSRQIILTGFREDARYFIGAADVLVIPSTQEGQGLAALEAMDAQVPVVAFAVGGIPETVLDGRTGLLVPPNDLDAMAKAIVKLIGSADLRRQLGSEGRCRVRDSYSVVQMMESTITTIREALSPTH
ncbi:MAG: glycosyltransferase family 4 protein [Armatimonadetes bacterium]|nr:glycosyltransferase family 4 protein [Armatimonadota bacterium]